MQSMSKYFVSTYFVPGAILGSRTEWKTKLLPSRNFHSREEEELQTDKISDTDRGYEGNKIG